MNSVLLEDFIIKNRGARIPRNPQLIFGDTNKYLRGDILDANAVVSEIASQVGDLVDTTPETLNTLKELAESLQETGGDINALVSRITDVETSVADLTQSQSTTIAELTSGLAADIAALQTGKVDAVSGKKLSTEDYTTADKNKLAGIEAGALVNPTNVSAFTNDAGYLTAHQSLAGYATEAWVNNQGFLTEHQDISNKANIADLATVATSGSYNDLTDTPDLSSILNGSNFVTEEQLNDIVGINTEGLQELKAILSDDDTTTGLLNAIDLKVEKVTGKLLSTEDYTTAEKTKLAGIEEGAQVNPTNVSELTNDAGYLVEDDLYNIDIDANGHEYVDLGLPSGTLWATMNIGATKPEEYGLYFAWGETQGYADASTKAFGWADYKWSDNGSSSVMTKYNATDGKTILDSEDDAAAVNWGGQWHMPTKAQCDELLNATYVTNAWVTDYQGSGINGRLFTSVSNGNTLFIPAAGYCYGGDCLALGSLGYVWASSLYSSDVSCALYIYFSSFGGSVKYLNRYSGRSVRGVLSSSKSPKYASATDVNGLLNVLDQKVDKDYMLETVTETVTETVSTEDANGHEYVEIGGIKWATMNVGASSETDYGNYYQYGKGAAQYATTNGSDDYSGTEDPLATSADTAAQVWGGTWRMPTKAEFESLIANTNYTWETNFNDSGVNGGKFTDKTDSSKYVFFAAAGDYSSESLVGDRISSYLWSSTPNGNNAYYVLFYDGVTEIRSDSRRYGNSVRGVLDSVTTTVETTIEHKVDKYATKEELGITFDANGHEYVDLDLPSGTLWATMNVGATSPTEVGGYYMYGHGTEAYEPWNLTPLSQTSENDLLLTPETDTATCAWGGSWETPSIGLIRELANNTIVSWVTENNVSCMKFTSKKDDTKYIVIPAGGFSVRQGASVAGITSTNMVWIMTSSLRVLAENNINSTPLIIATNASDYGYNVRPVIFKRYMTESMLSKVAISGSYTDLLSRPTIPAAQIQSDWNLTNTGSKDYIKNKPNVAVKLDVYTGRILSDIANSTWGGGWHIPTRELWEELFDNCDQTYLSVIAGTEMYGIKLISKSDSTKYIILTDDLTIKCWVYSYPRLCIKVTKPPLSMKSTFTFNSDADSAVVWPVLDSINESANNHEYVDLGLPSGTLWSSDFIKTLSNKTYNLAFTVSLDLPKFALSSVENRLTAISGQSEQTYIPRTVEDGQTSFISDATNIQNALNKLDDAIVDLLKWVEYEATIPVAFYRIDTNNPNYAGLVNTNGNVIIVTDGTSSKQFIVNVNDNTWIMADATELELPLHLRTTFDVQEYNGTIENNHVEFEIDGTSFIYNDGTLTPSVTEWQDS